MAQPKARIQRIGGTQFPILRFRAAKAKRPPELEGSAKQVIEKLIAQSGRNPQAKKDWVGVFTSPLKWEYANRQSGSDFAVYTAKLLSSKKVTYVNGKPHYITTIRRTLSGLSLVEIVWAGNRKVAVTVAKSDSKGERGNAFTDPLREAKFSGYTTHLDANGQPSKEHSLEHFQNKGYQYALLPQRNAPS